jgi:hypothetical protein
MSDKRTTMLKGAVAACFKAREPITVANVRVKLPEDFFLDFDSGEPLADAEVFHEIQATYSAAPLDTATPKFNAAGIVLDDTPVESNAELPPENEEDEEFSGDSLRDEWAPETVSMPVVEAEPVAEGSTANHAASGPGLSPQARLDAARERERDLLGKRPILQAAQTAARGELAKAVREYQEGGPRQTHESLARDFIAASNAERAARVAGEPWALKPERRVRGVAAYVDVERAYSQGGDANTFARRHNRTGNRRGAYGKQSLGAINHDPSRGPVPAPVETPRPTIPALGK